MMGSVRGEHGTARRRAGEDQLREKTFLCH